MGLYFMLIAGGGTGNKRDEDGAFVFDTSELISKTRWSTGSDICSLLVEVLTASLLLVVPFRLMYISFHHGLLGTSVPLYSKITIP